MPYFFLVLSAGCSVLIAHLLKVMEAHNLRTLPTLTINYLFAGIIAFILGMQGSSQFSFLHNARILFFCLTIGALFIGNFLMISKSIYSNGVGTTITVMRLSLAIPVLVSLFVYEEVIGWSTIIGILLVMGALVLLIPKRKPVKLGSINMSWLLLLIFFGSGLSDASIKIYHEQFRVQLNELFFMSLVFVAAFVIGLAAIIIKKEKKFTRREIIMGCLIGLPNLYASIFLINALDQINGAVAYPLLNILNVAGGTALGLWFWNDTISKRQWAGIAIALIAIMLLL